MSSLYREQIDKFGVKVVYYRMGFDVYNPENIIRGADLTTNFTASAEMFLYIDAPTMNMSLSQFGWYNQDDISAFVHQDVFTETFSTDTDLNPIPKAGDCIQLVEFNNFLFEISYRDNTPHPNANLMDYYTYLFNARRKVLDNGNGLPVATDLVMRDSVTDRFNLPNTTTPQLTAGQWTDGQAVDDASHRIYDYPGNEDTSYGGFDYNDIGRQTP